jgi:C_GCAxxG_C_C family probable redox protein
MGIMDKNKVSDKASYYFENGFHCAEAVAAAVLEGFGKDTEQAIVHATAFGGGFGRSFDEACGAISGGLIVIGHLYGRTAPGQDWDTPAGLAQHFRQCFLDEYHTTHCGTLRERFGKEKQSEKCSRLVKQVTKHLLKILEDSAEVQIKPCQNEI